MHQMLVLAFRVVEDGDKVQMSVPGTLLPSQAVPKYSPTGGTSKHHRSMEVPKYVQQGKASQCTVEQNFPEVSAVERKLKSQQSADARLIMSSAASVIYVQEYAAQDISKKHGKAQTCKNLSEV